MHGTITSMKILLHFNIATICIINYFVKVHVPWQFLSEGGDCGAAPGFARVC